VVPRQARRHLALELPEGVTASYEEVPNATALRRRLTQITGSTMVLDDEKPKGVASHPLVDPQNSALAARYSEIESELVGSGITRPLAGEYHVQKPCSVSTYPIPRI
jgi:hypothetical protein